MLELELVRADTLAEPIPALPISREVDLAGLLVGRWVRGRLALAAAAGRYARTDRGRHCGSVDGRSRRAGRDT